MAHRPNLACEAALSGSQDYWQATGNRGMWLRWTDLPLNPGPWDLMDMVLDGRRVNKS